MVVEYLRIKKAVQFYNEMNCLLACYLLLCTRIKCLIQLSLKIFYEYPDDIGTANESPNGASEIGKDNNQ